MPFTANRQFKKAPRMFVIAKDMHYTTVRRPQGDRRHGRPLVRQCRPWPPQDRRGRSRSRQPSWITRRPSRWAIRRRSSWPIAWSISRRRARPSALHQFRFGVGRDGAEGRAGLSPREGRGARTRLIGRERGYHGVNFGGISVGGIVTNRKMFGTLLTGVDHMPHTHDLARTPSPRASRSTAPISPTSSSASSRCMMPRPSPPSSSSRCRVRPAC
jgi:beta-alanine--pyruvate transaminase